MSTSAKLEKFANDFHVIYFSMSKTRVLVALTVVERLSDSVDGVDDGFMKREILLTTELDWRNNEIFEKKDARTHLKNIKGW